jgi:hypothetical protein
MTEQPGAIEDEDRRRMLREVGARVRKAVEMIGSEGRAADAAKVTVSTLHRYMRGEVAAPFVALAGIARAAKVSMDWLADDGAVRDRGGTYSPAPQYGGMSPDEVSGAVDADLLAAVLGATLTMGAPADPQARAQISIRMMHVIQLMCGDEGAWRRLDRGDFERLAQIAARLAGHEVETKDQVTEGPDS